MKTIANQVAGHCLFDTALGRLGLAWGADARLLAVQLPESGDARTTARLLRGLAVAPGAASAAPPPAVQAAIDCVAALMDGATDPLLHLQLDMGRVPDFHRRVYELARRIAPGHTRTYGALATELGDPGAARAVGQALGANPFAPVVPCHRILAASGKPGGFSAAGGLHTKLRLLEIERASFGGQAGLFYATFARSPSPAPPA